jgi:hypothetical protein
MDGGEGCAQADSGHGHGRKRRGASNGDHSTMKETASGGGVGKDGGRVVGAMECWIDGGGVGSGAECSVMRVESGAGAGLVIG